jgi:DNA-binding NarL/FixJ family response regulator
VAERLTVLVVDDNAVIRAGLRALLADSPDLEVVAEADDGDTALELAAVHRPEVVLLDVRMPRRTGLDVLAELAEHACVLMLTSTEDDVSVRQAMAGGARGYLVYGTFDEAALVQSIRSAASGSAVLSPRAARALVGSEAALRPQAPARRGGPPPGLRDHLSEREIAVLDLMAAGHSNGEIARALFLAPKTVKNHVNRIFAKLHVTSRAQAMAVWLGSTVPGPSSPR